jgi:spore coat polysaccharide biosynthesis predicted glycosyltransferase SpsG
MALRAIIRCDASPALGYGHVMRCMAIAEQMQQQDDWHIIFAMKPDRQGNAIARQHGFIVITMTADDDDGSIEARTLSALVTSESADALLLDIRTNLDRDAVSVISQDVLVICLDDLSDRRLAADLAIYPPIPQLERLSWQGFHGTLCSGWDWIPLRTKFLAARRTVNEHPAQRERPSVLITMGGSDPAGMTMRAVKALDEIDSPFDATIVLGPGFEHDEALANCLQVARHTYRIVRSPDSMASLLRESDLAVASFGATAYELTCVGVPSIYLCLTCDHAESAACLSREGAATVLGVHDRVSNTDVTNALSELIRDESLRQRMREKAMRLIDGRGVSRISTAITLNRRSIHETA